MSSCISCHRFFSVKDTVSSGCPYWNSYLGKIQLPMFSDSKKISCDSWEKYQKRYFRYEENSWVPIMISRLQQGDIFVIDDTTNPSISREEIYIARQNASFKYHGGSPWIVDYISLEIGIELWHESDHQKEVYDYLGISKERYFEYLEGKINPLDIFTQENLHDKKF